MLMKACAYSAPRVLQLDKGGKTKVERRRKENREKSKLWVRQGRREVEERWKRRKKRELREDSGERSTENEGEKGKAVLY